MRAPILAALISIFCPPALAGDCMLPFSTEPGCAWTMPRGSLTAVFVQDHNFRPGDTDMDGDRQAGELVLRLGAGQGLPVPAGDFVVGVRSMMDSSQAARGVAPGRPRQFDEIPSWATVGFEGGNLSAYVLGGTVNDGTAKDVWHDLKMASHRSSGMRSYRTSPFSVSERPLFGLQARLDEAVLFSQVDIMRLAVTATAFAQATSVKAEIGAAMHVGLGFWDKPPRFTVSDLPASPITGGGFWVGLEARQVYRETITRVLGTARDRVAITGGASLALHEDWPAIAFTTRHFLTEQVRGARESAVGEYRIQATVPFR